MSDYDVMALEERVASLERKVRELNRYFNPLLDALAEGYDPKKAALKAIDEAEERKR